MLIDFSTQNILSFFKGSKMFYFIQSHAYHIEQSKNEISFANKRNQSTNKSIAQWVRRQDDMYLIVQL